MPNNIQKTNRRIMDFIRHMRRSAFFPGRPGGLITEITWKAGRLEVICLHGGLRFPYIGRMAKNFRPSSDILDLIYSRFVQFMGVLCNGV